MNAEQEITGDIGVFARLGWNDLKIESFAFTAIAGSRQEVCRSTESAGTDPSIQLQLNSRPAGFPVSMRAYLARGGYDFLIGDGRLRYGPEYVPETY